MFLKPIAKNKQKEEKVAKQLKELRNRISTAFLLVNVIFVIVLFAFHLNAEQFYVPWFWGDAKIDPFGFIFLLLFGVIMFIQILGMLAHRRSIFLHIMSTTVIDFCRSKKTDTFDNVKDMIELAKRTGKLQYNDGTTISATGTLESQASDGGDDTKENKNVRKTAFKINKKLKFRRAINPSVNYAFQKRLTKLAKLDTELEVEEIQRKVFPLEVEEIQRKVFPMGLHF